jgi:hypothetical protein
MSSAKRTAIRSRNLAQEQVFGFVRLAGQQRALALFTQREGQRVRAVAVGRVGGQGDQGCIVGPARSGTSVLPAAQGREGRVVAQDACMQAVQADGAGQHPAVTRVGFQAALEDGQALQQRGLGLGHAAAALPDLAVAGVHVDGHAQRFGAHARRVHVAGR